MRVMSLLATGFEGAQPITFIAVLVWLLHKRKLYQFVILGENQCPDTAAPQQCTIV